MNKSLLEQARNHAKNGIAKADWNEVLVGDKSYTMEYPASETMGRMDITSMEISPAYIRKANKHKCGLCTMWYEKKSVCYTVPNHRIIELRRSWNYNQEGKRYESASYKYTNTPICMLCSQFFSESTEATCTSKPAEKNTKAPLYKTSITRTDVAEGKKTYQSNEVDGQGSNLAIMPPYTLGSKTRREADPWWELDLGMSYHLNSVSITIKSAVQQELEVNIILFDGPVGFENPFLDSMKEECVAMHTVMLPANSRPKKEIVEWDLPGNTTGGALRVQLRGFHTLHLYRFQAFQGDSIHDDNLQKESEKDFLKSQMSLEIGENGFDTLVAAEDKRRFNSYASYHPDTFKNTKAYKDRMNISFSRSSSKARRKDSTLKSALNSSVADLTSKYRKRHLHVNDWIDRAKEASKYFTTEELVVARDMIFNSAMASAADEKKRKAEENMQGKTAGMLKRQQSLGTARSDQYMTVVRAQDMYGAALNELYPRVPLEAVTKALRGCAAQVQGRDQKGEIGLMQQSPRFLFLYSGDTYIIDRFEIIARALKDRVCRRSRANSPTHDTMTDGSVTSLNSGDVNFQQEISWSQFAIVLYCLSVGTPDHILPLAFNRFDVEVADDNEMSTKRKKRQQQEFEATTPHTHRTNDDDDGFFITASESNSPRNGIDDTHDVTMMRTRPLTPANASPPKKSSKLARALLPQKSSGVLSPNVSMISTAPGALQKVSTKRFDRNKREPMTLKEKTKNELLDKLNLNFGHAQYKLGRIQTRVNVDVAPRRLRVKLTNVKLSDIPGGLNALKLGLTCPEELFEIGAGLSATGEPVEFDQSYLLENGGQCEVSSPNSQHSMSVSSSVGDKGATRSLDMDEQSDDFPDDMSDISLNQILRNKRAAAEKPRKLMAQDSFTSKASMMSQRKSTVEGMGDLKRPSTTGQLQKLKSAGSFKFPATPPKQTTAAPSMIRTSSFKSMVDDYDMDDPSEASSQQKSIAFRKSCALCLFKFPLTSLTNRALLKHVVDLRRLWNPKLVTKFEGRLAEGMTLYSLVPVCHLCNQYFDPDFESGISPPNQSKPNEEEKNAVLKPRKEPCEFYDNRHSGLKEAGYILREDDTIVLRSRAKRANEISEELKQESEYHKKTS